jgi:outer membrane protein TolC
MVARLSLLQLFLAFAFATARNDPPPSADRTWSPPNLPKYESELAAQRFNNAEGTSRVSINPRKIYNLAELIDIAERNNPETRVAWERARQAAAAVGLSESAYYPFLAASAAAGYDRAFIPFPTLAVNQKKLASGPNLSAVSITGGGSLVTEAQVYRGELTAKWLLLDFGERSATVAAAREQLMMANVGFNATHQKIVFQVTDRFYQLGTARQKVLVSQSALEAAQTVEQAVQARIDNGLATNPELLQAQQQTAQSEFDVEATTGAESDARVVLVESIGILPTVPLKVADLGQRSAQTNGSVDELITRALSQRPDLVAKLANLHAKEDGIRKVRAEYYPKVAIDAHVSETELDVSVAHSPYFGDHRPTYGVFLTASVPIFDGFGRRHKMEMAEAELHGAENELAGARDSAVREVWKAYTDFKTALRKQDSAAKLVAASQNAFDAVLESYKNGLSTYPEIVSAQRNLASARSVSHDTQAAIFTTATELTLSTGDLARPTSRPLRPSAVRPLESSPRGVRPMGK